MLKVNSFVYNPFINAYSAYNKFVDLSSNKNDLFGFLVSCFNVIYIHTLLLSVVGVYGKVFWGPK